MRKEVEIKCPYCNEKEKITNSFDYIKSGFQIYNCNECNGTFRVEYEFIPTYCGKWE